MKISILCVGKIKEKFYKDAVDEYRKRLSAYCKTEIIEVADEKTPDGASVSVEEQIKKKEGERLLSKVKEDAFVIALVINGERLDSAAFASLLQKTGLSGKSHIQFVIGGSLGLHEAVIKRADFKLSFSDMTFPHQLMRVILCEQIYRAFMINAGSDYHK